MSFIEHESGIITGEPIELYEFVFPDKTYRYSNSINTFEAVSGLTLVIEDWEPASIKRGSIKTSGAKGAEPLIITSSLNFLPAVLFKDYSKTRIKVRVYRTHVGDNDSEVFLLGQWYITNVSFNDTNSLIAAGSIASILQTELPRYYYQFQCNHELYGADCGAVPSFLTGTILNINPADTRLITLSIIPPVASKLGVITVGSENRMIIAADGISVITVLEPFEHITGTVEFSMHDRGCDREYSTCTSLKFENGNNFGGMPFIPLRNVFVGGL